MENNHIKLLLPSLGLVPRVCEAIQESERALAEFLPWVKYALTEEDCRESMREAIANAEGFQRELRFFIVDKRFDRLLGAIGLIIRDKSVPFFELGYWLRSSAQGRGHMAAAVSLLERHAFDELGANRLEIRCAESNRRSRAVAERGGYVLEATLHNERRLPSGRLDNTVIYGKFPPRSPLKGA
ncbi:acetyltransferase [Zobellella denitrificans]|uniref:Acetyltransferase n=1 Tax=Zobellella denitrificans TaxID=347534 RepID=A0A291HUR2_9GAMM|nr:GNAT family N-acetyltransferase [Zobellella denitrificans]ATG75887.1 acetyltransferase [Zobellella denitrificans]